MDHLIYFSNRKLSSVEKKYTTIKREALAMVYSLQTFRHWGPFKFFTNHSASRYLVNKSILEGRIYRWLLLFQDFTYEVIIKLGQLNVGPNHISRLELGESGGSLDDQLLDSDLFCIEEIPDYLKGIVDFLATRQCLEEYTVTQRRYMVVTAADYQLIAGHLYKIGLE